MNEFLPLLPASPGIKLHRSHFDADQQLVRVELSLMTADPPCPSCQTASCSVHSHYQRQVLDLPWGTWKVRLQLRVRRFRCKNTACPRGVFCERLPSLVAPWARRTLRLAEHQRQLGLALGDAAGERFAAKGTVQVSGSTLLRLIRSVPCPTFPTPRVLGVDDWAMRKRHTYGTVLVDLERRKPVALLADREANTLRDWLVAHPGVEIVARDRFRAFADGVRLGAPQAQHVLDRFHLMQNLSVTLEKVLGKYRGELDVASPCPTEQPVSADLPPALHDAQVGGKPPSPKAIVVPPGLPTGKSKERRQQRLQRFEQIRGYHGQGWTVSAIARHLNTDRRSVRHAVQADCFPEFRRRARKLDPYKAHLIHRWNEGCRTGPLLFAELQALGYRGQITAVALYLQRLRQAQGLPRRSRNAHPDHPLHHQKLRDDHGTQLTPVEAAFSILRRPERRVATDEALSIRLCAGSAGLQEVVELARRFAHLLRSRTADGFPEWLTSATRCADDIMSRFARGLQQAEGDALTAALSSPWSNGQVKGQVNRLKVLKRQMYGRAKLDLLEHRFLSGP